MIFLRMTNNAIASNRMAKIKMCKDGWHYKPVPTPNAIPAHPEPTNKSACCDFYNDLNSVKPDDTCENWESNKLKLISIIKSLYGL